MDGIAQLNFTLVTTNATNNMIGIDLLILFLLQGPLLY